MTNKFSKSKFPRKPLDYAFFLLGIKDRSVGEIQNKMTKKGFKETEVIETIRVLKEKKFLDDERFVENLIRVGLKTKNHGKRRIWQDLKKKFISDDLIEEALSGIEKDDERESVEEAAASYLRKRGKPKDYAEKQKMIAYLSRRGFSWEVIEKVIP